MSRPNLAKLPRSVRIYIEKLEKDLADARQSLDATRRTDAGTSDVALWVLEEGRPVERPLPPRSTVIFHLGQGRSIQVRVAEQEMGGPPRIKVNGTNQYGSGMLAVAPRAANNLDVFIDPQDERDSIKALDEVARREKELGRR
jgi:hypothetical protein